MRYIVCEVTQLILSGVLVWLLWYVVDKWRESRTGWERQAKGKGGRVWHAQSPKECPLCREAHGQVTQNRERSVEPWRVRKSKQGRPKTVDTEGHSCANEACVYYAITDSAVHALVGYGKHHGVDSTQYFKCQACGTKVSARWNTAMYDLKTAVGRVEEVTTALSEGVDVSAAHRIFKHDERTIQRWLDRSGEHARRAHAHFFHHLVCHHLQLDELVTKLRGMKDRLYIWVALDAHTKIIPAIRVGERKREDAMGFVHELWQRLAPGAPPVFTTDGLRLYFYALTAHFGQWVPQAGKRRPVWQVDPRLLYGQLHKVKSGYKLKAMYTVAVLGTRAELRAALGALRLTGRIMTSYVERVNLTLREHLAPLSRRTWSLARDTLSLNAYLEWGRAYYHFCRPHHALRLPTCVPHRYRARTPAMAAGLVKRRWRVSTFLLTPFLPV
jgi:IS1 family transposase